MAAVVLTISIITPVFNGAHHLGPAAETIGDQSVRGRADIELEWIIVDDHSTDDTLAVATAISAATPWLTTVRTLDRQHGPAGARNVALDIAGGELVTFLDADDLWPADRLEVLVSRLARSDGLDFVLGRVREEIDPASDGFWETQAMPVEAVNAPVLLGSGLYRREVFDTVGRLDESLWFGEDIDWYLRAVEAGSAHVIVDHVVHRHRLHNGNMTRDRAEVARSIQVVLMRSLRRRRALGTTAAYPDPSSLVEPLERP